MHRRIYGWAVSSLSQSGLQCLKARRRRIYQMHETGRCGGECQDSWGLPRVR